jgi:hypothetical protein
MRGAFPLISSHAKRSEAGEGDRHAIGMVVEGAQCRANALHSTIQFAALRPLRHAPLRATRHLPRFARAGLAWEERVP